MNHLDLKPLKQTGLKIEHFLSLKLKQWFLSKISALQKVSGNWNLVAVAKILMTISFQATAITTLSAPPGGFGDPVCHTGKLVDLLFGDKHSCGLPVIRLITQYN